MHVRQIHIENFRNYACAEIEFGSASNALFGRNGQGKTNILEAIFCLCLTKSFYAVSDTTLVQLGQDTFKIAGILVDDAGTSRNISLEYEKTTGRKTLAVKGIQAECHASIVGRFPVVVLSTENHTITLGAPSDRRKFLDLLLSQLSRAYFEDLMEYRHVLQQRNRILFEAKQRGTIRRDVLEPWSKSLSDHGARVIHRRSQFVEEFKNYVSESYAELVSDTEEPAIAYVSTPEAEVGETIDSLSRRMLSEIEKRSAEECRRGLSLVGPHRDDVGFALNDIDLQKYASQGQHKTFLIALKIAEFHYLKEKKGEAPILLLDDVLSELDGVRSKRLLDVIRGAGQTVVTATDDTPFRETTHWGAENRTYYVEAGTCRPIDIGNGKEAAVGA